MSNCVFNNNIICNCTEIKSGECNGEQKYTKDDMKNPKSTNNINDNEEKVPNNILRINSLKETYCIGLRSKRISKVYKLTPDGKRKEIARSKIPEPIKNKYNFLISNIY